MSQDQPDQQKQQQNQQSLFTDFIDTVFDYNTRFFKAASEKILSNTQTTQSVFFDFLDSLQAYSEKATSNPGRFVEQQIDLWKAQMQLWQSTLLKLAGQPQEAVIHPEKGDTRFQAKDWSDNPLFDYIKQSYLLTSRTILDSIAQTEGLDDKLRHKLEFFARQYVNAMSPSNFVSTNPELLKLTLQEGGMNLAKGMEHFIEDLETSADALNIKMTDTSAFRIGENIATTPGKVIFRNRLIELIQYNPTTTSVFKTPLLVIPPWINKYYILDLRENNSFVKWCTQQGFTTFIISWVNPDASYKEVGIFDYMQEGVLAAISAIEQSIGETQVNTVGYCIGGVLLALTNAWLAAHRQEKKILASTYLASMLDTSAPGDLGAFIDAPLIKAIEEHNEKTGYFDGRLMAVSFNMLRENALYWNYYVQNYLKGESPAAFDLLYWNSDCTNITAACHHFILTDWYLNNTLIQPGQMPLGDIQLDLGKIKIPSFFLATKQDHIANWKTTYSGAKHLGGPLTFVLAESGHIAGVVNPPEKNKYGHWVNASTAGDHEEWLKHAKREEGSWWPAWKNWAVQFGGEQTAARDPAKGKLVPLADAPGDYVLQRCR